ncbi:MAG: hypothetical protein P1U77_15305 [Rubripirellula sp.]|nr:hypothetical protein [Rubripirellula sp.]
MALRLGKQYRELGRLLAGWRAGALGRWIAAEFLAMQIAISVTADTGVCGAFEVPTRRIASDLK